MKKLIVTYQYYGDSPGWSPHYIFNLIFDALRSAYIDIEFVRQEEHFVDKIAYWTHYPNPHVMAITNPDNNKRIIISYSDNNKSMFLKDEEFGWDIEKIVQCFISSDYFPIKRACDVEDKRQKVFNEFNSDDLNLNVTSDIFVPFTYPVWNSHFERNVIDSLYSTRGELEFAKNRKQAMVFRGFLWEPRKNVTHHGTHPEISFTEDRLTLEEYGNELLAYRCGLSLNGNAEICNRDIELMALGIPVLRPLLQCSQTATPLIPNVHYVSFDFPRQPFAFAGYPGAPYNHNSELVWNALVARWEEIKHDYDFLDYVGQNARIWYEENGKFDQHVRIFMEKVNLSLLQ